MGNKILCVPTAQSNQEKDQFQGQSKPGMGY